MIYLFVSDLIGVKENSNIIQYVIKSRIGLWIHRLQLPLGLIVSDSVSAEFLYVLCRVGMFSPVWVRKGRVGEGRGGAFLSYSSSSHRCTHAGLS